MAGPQDAGQGYLKGGAYEQVFYTSEEVANDRAEGTIGAYAQGL
jgi:hypothetical protein